MKVYLLLLLSVIALAKFVSAKELTMIVNGTVSSINEVSEEEEEALLSTSQCDMICEEKANHQEKHEKDDGDVVKLKILTHFFSSFTKPSRDRFVSSKHGMVEVEYVEVPLGQLPKDILNEAQSQVGLYDGYITGATWVGSAVPYDGLADLTPFIQESAERVADWSDILLVWRKLLAQYQDKIVLYPVDSDTFFLFYRKDILDHFNLTTPRTWDEYNQVAAAVHGKVYENKTLIGSCLAFVNNCVNHWYAAAVLASMTQTLGQWQGHMFDTKDMKPLAGEAMAKTLELLEGQAQFGHPDQFDKCLPLVRQAITEGVCAMTYNHGNTYDYHLLEGSVFADKTSKAKLGVAQTPGSQMVLDRETMKLVPCTKELCPHAIEYPDIGLVNYAPAMAFGGWTCAVNNYTSTRKKRLAMEFCAFLSSKEQTQMANVYNATRGSDAVIGGSPFRTSLLDPDLYIDMGYEADTTYQYLEAVQYSLEHPNPQTDIRFPTAPEIDSALDRHVRDHLMQTTTAAWNDVPQEVQTAKRQEVTEQLVAQWEKIISDYDRTSRTAPVLEAYQRLRNVYTVDQDYNYIGQIKAYGIVLMSLALFSAIGLGVWTVYNKNGPTVRASQPFFLAMICTGAIIFALSIFPMGVDDSTFSLRGCSIACMSIPWLLACGWTIIFSAIYAKLNRINIVIKNARSFRRVAVTEKDVLPPFAIMFTTNLTLLLLWTFIDPLTWKRIQTSEESSYGTCTMDPARPAFVWKLFASLLAIVNIVALIMANYEAYKSRAVATELGESKWIAMAMGSLMQLVLVAIPLLFLVNDNPTASYFVRSSMVFVVTVSILGFMFVPKIIASCKPGASDMGNSKRASSFGFSSASSTQRSSGNSFYTSFPRRESNTIQSSTGISMDDSSSAHPAPAASDVGGLKFSIVTKEAQIQLDEHIAKVALLKVALEEQGVDADSLFSKVGLQFADEHRGN